MHTATIIENPFRWVARFEQSSHGGWCLSALGPVAEENCRVLPIQLIYTRNHVRMRNISGAGDGRLIVEITCSRVHYGQALFQILYYFKLADHAYAFGYLRRLDVTPGCIHLNQTMLSLNGSWNLLWLCSSLYTLYR